jgi:N-acyl-D-aspartate/D-glutamate deacylase
MPAEIYGIPDRGRLMPGMVADVVCFDPTRVAMREPERVSDLPAGASRWVVRAEGIELVLVAGVELLSAGGAVGDERPGRLLGPRAAASG